MEETVGKSLSIEEINNVLPLVNTSIPAVQLLNISQEEKIKICGSNFVEADHAFLKTEFWCSGVLVCFLGGFGLLGNFLSCITLRNMSKQTLFNKLLMTLAIIDVLFILAGGAFMTKQAFGYDSKIYTMMFPILTYPMAGLSMTGSTYLCVAISVERYLGICHVRSNLNRKFSFYLVIIVLLSLAIECPRFFEIEGYQSNNTFLYRYAKHRWSASYVTYYSMWFRLFATALVPLVALVFFNFKILMYYKANNFVTAHSVNSQISVARARSRRVPRNARDSCVLGQTFVMEVVHCMGENQEPNGGAELDQDPGNSVASPTRHNSQGLSRFSIGKALATSHLSVHERRLRQERTLFVMLCCITLTFFICHCPRICINVYEFVRQESVIFCVHEIKMSWNLPRWAMFLNQVSNTLLIFNSSCNFIYYCFVGKQFRNELFKILEVIYRRLRQVLRCCCSKSLIESKDNGDTA